MTPTFKLAERMEDGAYELLEFSFYSYADAKRQFEEFTTGRPIDSFALLQAVWTIQSDIYIICGWIFML